MSARTWSRPLVYVCALTAPLLLAGCPLWWLPPEGGNGNSVLVPFESSGEMLDYFKNQANQQVMWRGGWLFGPPGALDVNAGAAEGGGDGTSAGDSFSTTNLQELGVDESDVLKSDGEYFYVADGARVRIVRATPADGMEEVARLTYDYTVDSLYLFGSKLIVLAQAYDFGPPDGAEILIWPPYHVGTTVFVYEVDVTDPSNPEQTGQIELEGCLVSSRLTNERLIIVLTIVPELPPISNPLTIGVMTLDQVLPKAHTAEGAQDMVVWNDWYHPSEPDGYYMAAVVTLDANDVETMLGSVGVMANAGTIYASTEALYLTDTAYTLTNEFRETTSIHKLDFDDNGVAQYVGSGAVPGRLLNQFSLGEYEGYLRVATYVSSFGGFFAGGGDADGGSGTAEGGETGVDAATAQDRQPPQPFNAVYVLAEDGGALTVVGSLEDLAVGEQIYSARFLAERGFLVTFRQIDPLFALDLSDPTAPQVVGELKIPGYSDYLHPLGDTHLIGVGRSTRETAWGGVVPHALQLSLFDVSDLANPTLVEQVEVGGSGSISDVSWTHKAFTLLEVDGQTVLAIPVQLWPDTPGDEPTREIDGKGMYLGVLCFEVDPAAGFTQMGDLPSVVVDDGYWYWVEWQRAALIGSTLYAVTPDGVRAAPLADLEDTTTLEFEE